MAREGGNGHGFYLHPQGMLECCIDYLNELHDNRTIPSVLGTEIACEYCKGYLKLNNDGVWVWIISKTKNLNEPK